MTSLVWLYRFGRARAICLTLSFAAALGGCVEVVPSGPGTVTSAPTIPVPPAIPQPGTVPATPTIPVPPAMARLGTVTATVPTVFVNRGPVQGARPLNDGDKVATDATGRAHIELPGRGTVDLEPNTDPWFIREGGCVVVRILFGGALVSGSSLCVEDDQGTRVVLNSAVHVHVAQGRTSITVVEGAVHLQRIARAPTQETLTQSQRIVVMNGRVQQRINVPRTEIEVLRQRFLVPARRMQPGQPSPQIIR